MPIAPAQIAQATTTVAQATTTVAPATTTAAPDGGMQISWEVRNRFRLFREGKSVV